MNYGYEFIDDEVAFYVEINGDKVSVSYDHIEANAPELLDQLLDDANSLLTTMGQATAAARSKNGNKQQQFSEMAHNAAKLFTIVDTAAIRHDASLRRPRPDKETGQDTVKVQGQTRYER